MSELLIGLSIDGYPDFNHVPDFYNGMVQIQSTHPSLIIINMDFKNVEDSVIERLKTLLEKKNIPTLIIGDRESIKIFKDLKSTSTLQREILHECIEESLHSLRKLNSIDNQIKDISTQRRTAPFYILGVILLCEPLIKLFYLQLKTQFPISKVLEIVLSIQDPMKAIEFWCVFPLAGIALLRPRAWSLFTFMGVHVYSLMAFLNYEKFSWPFVQETPHISSTLLVCLNCAILVYFLIPENRKPFVNKTKEMFRRFNRVPVNLYGKLIFNENKINVNLLDLSLSGVKFSCSKNLSEFKKFELEFLEFHLKLKLKRINEIRNGEYIYGAKFARISKSERKKLDKTINELDAHSHITHRAA